LLMSLPGKVLKCWEVVFFNHNVSCIQGQVWSSTLCGWSLVQLFHRKTGFGGWLLESSASPWWFSCIHKDARHF
jgi:hypothetical protein